MQFNLKPQNDFKNNIRREWALTNGLGGYAGGSVTGAINRTHQGYLIASLHAPVQRYVCFSKTNEKKSQTATPTTSQVTSSRAGATQTASNI